MAPLGTMSSLILVALAAVSAVRLDDDALVTPTPLPKEPTEDWAHEELKELTSRNAAMQDEINNRPAAYTAGSAASSGSGAPQPPPTTTAPPPPSATAPPLPQDSAPPTYVASATDALERVLDRTIPTEIQTHEVEPTFIADGRDHHAQVVAAGDQHREIAIKEAEEAKALSLERANVKHQLTIAAAHEARNESDKLANLKASEAVQRAADQVERQMSAQKAAQAHSYEAAHAHSQMVKAQELEKITVQKAQLAHEVAVTERGAREAHARTADRIQAVEQWRADSIHKINLAADSAVSAAHDKGLKAVESITADGTNSVQSVRANTNQTRQAIQDKVSTDAHKYEPLMPRHEEVSVPCTVVEASHPAEKAAAIAQQAVADGIVEPHEAAAVASANPSNGPSLPSPSQAAQAAQAVSAAATADGVVTPGEAAHVADAKDAAQEAVVAPMPTEPPQLVLQDTPAHQIPDGCEKKGFMPCGTGVFGRPNEYVLDGEKYCCEKGQ